eukprot:1153944-Pelagomonas_calceolata.AAC.5
MKGSLLSPVSSFQASTAPTPSELLCTQTAQQHTTSFGTMCRHHVAAWSGKSCSGLWCAKNGICWQMSSTSSASFCRGRNERRKRHRKNGQHRRNG